MSSAKASWFGLSLNLHPYHLLYVAGVAAVVLVGTLWSWLFDTNGYHLRIDGVDHLDILHMAPSSSPTSHSQFLPPSNYFALKSNLFNTYFVKLGWAWNICIWTIQFVLLRSTYNLAIKEREGRRKRKLDKLIRHKYRQLRRQFEMENASADTIANEELGAARGQSSVVQRHADMSPSTTSQRCRQLQPQQQELLLKQAQSLLQKERERERSHGPQFVSAPFRSSIMRLVLATSCWFVFTTWFFGPALMVRVYQWTGGQCMPVLPVSTVALPYAPSFKQALKEAVDASYCINRKAITADSHPQFFLDGDRIAARVAAGGGMQAQWKGGHDVSGHTFLLVLSVLWLLEEITPFLPYLIPPLEELFPARTWWPANPFHSFAYAANALGLAPPPHRSSPGTGPVHVSQPQIQISSPDFGATSPPLQEWPDYPPSSTTNGVGPAGPAGTSGASASAASAPPELLPILLSPTTHSFALAAVLALIGLWLWMLLMTQIFFHTAHEKLSGLGVGIAAWLLVRFFTPKV